MARSTSCRPSAADKSTKTTQSQHVFAIIDRHSQGAFYLRTQPWEVGHHPNRLSRCASAHGPVRPARQVALCRSESRPFWEQASSLPGWRQKLDGDHRSGLSTQIRRCTRHQVSDARHPNSVERRNDLVVGNGWCGPAGRPLVRHHSRRPFSLQRSRPKLGPRALALGSPGACQVDGRRLRLSRDSFHLR